MRGRINFGGGALSRSTLLKKLNKENYKGAANEFKKWIHADGSVKRGLVRRRFAEERLFKA